MPVKEFASSPSTLPLMLRAALPAVPVVGSLPGIAHRGEDVPDLTYVRHGVSVDPSHLRSYEEVCGFRGGDILPATYPHVLAFGLQLAMMNDPSFPFAPLGLVHLRNTITQSRPIRVHERLEVSVRPANLRPHPKGRLIDLLTSVDSGAEQVWEETTTVFRRGHGDADSTDDSPLRDVEVPTGPVTWRLGSDLGRRYASVSGDRNPIHLYGVTAKAFGFPSQIAHGMWTKARCLADLEGEVPDAFTVTVEFRKPVLLPTTVQFGVRREGSRSFLGVTDRDGGRDYLAGLLEPS